MEPLDGSAGVETTAGKGILPRQVKRAGSDNSAFFFFFGFCCVGVSAALLCVMQLQAFMCLMQAMIAKPHYK
jgi:hypothetical protein